MLTILSVVKTILIWTLSSWSKIPASNLNAIFDKATALANDYEGVSDLTGWEKLEAIVNRVVHHIPAQYSAIASTVATLVVNAARLYNLLKK